MYPEPLPMNDMLAYAPRQYPACRPESVPNRTEVQDSFRAPVSPPLTASPLWVSSWHTPVPVPRRVFSEALARPSAVLYRRPASDPSQ